MKNLNKILLTGTSLIAIILTTATISKATTIKITGDTINVRKGPSTDTDIVAMLSKDVECELLEEQDDWYKIKYKNYVGFISKQYSKKVEEQSNNTKEENSKPKEENSKPKEEESNNTNDKKEEIEKNEITNVKEENKVYKKIKENAEIKILPLIYSSKIANVKKGEKVSVLTNTNNWAYIQTEEISGWIRNKYLEENDIKEEKKDDEKIKNEDKSTNNEKSEENKIGYINEDFVNVRSEAGTDSKIIKVLALNSKVTIIGEEKNWYKVKSGEDIGYISKDLISSTKKVTSRNLKNSRTENKEKVEKKNDTNNTSSEKTINDIKINNNKQPSKVDNVVSKTDKANIKGTDIVAYAKKYLGHKYVYGGNGSNGTFDCSGFTMYVFKHFGIKIPHGANSQYKCGKGTKITKQEDLQVGDIVFLTDYKTGKGIGHCGIYMGNGNFIHASTTTYSVTISSLNTMYKGRFYAGLRLI